ncbi:hypothetical protein DX980_00325 (plasmid) [Burkholderia gladioli]|uniref:hypothetical protein n=1 Tax=Burkholderia gladioli TaxID=28095 RepID=UPI001364A10A|nr:hypothetical protein [Burkholderia gladioli]KAF1065562.1 hypothetical protein LvStA_00054 [Burkholderia gladioli]WAG17843.1 hypothetical protein DX980_00325 [Burkholderia gladioli]
MNDTHRISQPTEGHPAALVDAAAVARFAAEYVAGAGVPERHQRAAREHATAWFHLKTAGAEAPTLAALRSSLARVFEGYGVRP